MLVYNSVIMKMDYNNLELRKFFTSWIIFINIFLIIMDKTNLKIQRWVWDSFNCLGLTIFLVGMFHFVVFGERLSKHYQVDLKVLGTINIVTHFIPFLVTLYYKPNPKNLVGEKNPRKSFLLGMLVFGSYCIIHNTMKVYIINHVEFTIMLIISISLLWFIIHKMS